MIKAPWRSRRARWAVPSGAVAAVLVVSAGSLLTSASAAPSLAPRTPAQLIADIAATRSWPSALSGTITTSASLGLPSLPTGNGGPGSGTSILTGTHTFQFWYGGPGKLHIAAPVPLGETDLRVNGSSVWLWDSKTSTATHLTVPSRPARVFGGRPGHHPALPQPSQTATITATMTPTPQQIARRLLAAIGPTTTVAVASNVTVAGRPAYQLTLAPKSTQSLVGQVAIAVDAATHLPLRVQVTARGSASPAFSAGYTAISFAVPAASNFTFTPPPGAKVKNVKPGSAGGPFAGLGGGLPFTALPWAVPHHGMRGRFQPGASKADPPQTPVTICSPGQQSTTSHCIVITPKGHGGMPSGRGAAEFGRAPMSLHHPHRAGAQVFAPRSRAWFSGSSADGGQQVIGTGWTAVHVLAAPGLSGTGAQPAGPLGALLKAATPVHGSWGSGRLLRTTLLSVLITSDGKVLIGAVTPDLLYADVSGVK